MNDRRPRPLTSSPWMSTRSKAPSPVILKPPPPLLRKLLQSYSHSIRQGDGARKPRLRCESLPSWNHRTSSGLLVGPNDVGGGLVVVGTAVEVDGEVVVVAGVATRWNPRQPSRAATTASPMTPASRTDQRR